MESKYTEEYKEYINEGRKKILESRLENALELVLGAAGYKVIKTGVNLVKEAQKDAELASETITGIADFFVSLGLTHEEVSIVVTEVIIAGKMEALSNGGQE